MDRKLSKKDGQKGKGWTERKELREERKHLHQTCRDLLH